MKMLVLGGSGAIQSDAINKSIFPKIDLVTSFLLSQKNIYIYNASKSVYEYSDSNEDEDDASVDSGYKKYDSNGEEFYSSNNNVGDGLYGAASRFVIALINDPWFIFFIMSYKFTYCKETRVTQFKCPVVNYLIILVLVQDL